MRLEEAIRQFLLSGKAGGWAVTTEAQYRWQLERWRLAMADKGIVDVEQVTSVAVREFGASLAGHYALSTRRVAAISLRSFVKWCDDDKLLTDGDKLVKAIKAPKVPQQAQRTVTSAEIEKLFAACEEPAATGLSRALADVARLRNAATISLLFDSLLRSAELCRLVTGDLDLDRQRVLVRGKGGKRSWVRFGEDTAERLRAWLAVRETVADSDLLFVGVGGITPGKGLTPSGLRAILKRIGKRAGVGDLSTHAFRRGGAVAQLEAGAPSRVVQMHGRWETINMVETYSRALDADSQFDKYSPIGQLSRNGHAREPTR